MTSWRPSNGPVWYRSLPHLLAMFILSACGGGGCSTCDGCGVSPIPGGFKVEERVANATQIRLTPDGISFLEDNIGSLVTSFLPDGLDFEIPRTEEDFLGTLTICPGSDCIARAEIDSVDIQPVAPNRLEIHLELILDSRNTAGARRGLPIDYWACGGEIDLDTRRGSRDVVGINADIVLANETRNPRTGYTRLVVENTMLDPSQPIENADVEVRDCVLSGLLNLARGLIIDQLTSQVDGLLQDALDEQLCTTQGEFGCPTGTVADGPAEDDVCRFTAGGECVPILLGTDGQGDLGAAFLGSISPGTHAPGQFLLAAGGEGEAVNNGMSLFMYGGFLGTSRDFSTTPANNPCVPALDPPPLPTIPRVATFRGNTVPGLATPPHVGIGLAESFLDHAGYGMYDAGLLCIGAGTPLAQELSTGLFSLLVPSLNRLAFPLRNAPLAVVLRPQNPPDFEIGAGTEVDPLLNVELPQLQIDFYVYSQERFVRFMTYEADFSIPINLSVMDGEIVPNILGLTAANSVVTNQEVLLTEDPAMLAGVIEDILSAFASMAFEGLGGFELPELMGLELQVPEGGIRGIEESGEEFLGIFANLAVAGPSAFSFPADTRLEVGTPVLDPEAMTLANWGNGEIPKVDLFFEADGPEGVEFEYSYRLDNMQWQPWTTEEHVVFESRTLLFQAVHTIEARARVVGERDTVDLTPASAEVVIDVLAPAVELESVLGGTLVTARDVISDDLRVRFREPGDEWSDWAVLEEDHVIGSDGVDVEVRDASGNVGSASNALIRGRPNPSADGGCACAVPGQSDNRPLGGLALIGLMMIFLRPRRSQQVRKEVGSSKARTFREQNSSLALAATRPQHATSHRPFASTMNDIASAHGRTTSPTLTTDRQALGLSSALRVILPFVLAIAGCDCGSNPGPGDTGLPDGPLPDGEFPDGETPDTGPAGPLDPGNLATHLDMAVLSDGSTLVLSGYNAGVPPSTRYGDLVVGAWNGTSVDWESVDGIPDVPPSNDPAGYRGGISDPGDDVGEYTSIIATTGDTLNVTYFDATNGALKFASGTLGGAWDIQTVDDEGWAGQYSELTEYSGGLAAAYLAVMEPASLPGRPTSEVRVATAPAGGASWTIARVGTAEIDCRPQFCPEGASCLENGQCVADPGDDTPLDDPFIEDRPPAIGLFTRIAATPDGNLALVYYDRAAGNIMGSAFDGAAWGAPFLIDGYGAGDPDVGDCGVGASLAVDDAGTWHVSYVDGAEETLRYARVEGTTPTTMIVDDGSTDGTNPHPDGRHIVGDDSSIVVTGSGEIRIAYQDATSQRAILARGPGDGTWAIQIVDMDDSAGYFTTQQLVGTTSFVAHWWRQQMRDMLGNGVRVSAVD